MVFPRRLVLLLVVAAALAPPVSASAGDRSPAFLACVDECLRTVCVANPALPLVLALFRWDCRANCQYTCMHHLTDLTSPSNPAPYDKIMQYHGKWPFWRVAGIQEPASVLFSLFNLYAHLSGIRTIRARLAPDTWLKPYYLLWGLVAANAWIASALFHSRDTPLSEKLDYFSAAASILYSLYYSIIRIFRLRFTEHTTLWSIWTAICTILFLAHVLYLSSLPRFDYTYNTIVNLAVGLLHNILWLGYSFPAYFPSTSITAHNTSSKARRKPAPIILLTTLATLLELLDFPPWYRIIDAHALWHLSTSFLVPMWYSFLLEDAREEATRNPSSSSVKLRS
ncbi:Per1-like protein [Sistotremastrum suecicum HHB10207 ss-3]|uniref:Post-GPI attachment to proteins factor 3 n=1 Tax=Sistotremastrum suecicum HHB10207 ss-3 TaxID=1314776 RepID=A0A166BGA5_9AGAM|nr:Per1-like protein [Sistotremastrum suecicum HHB10207 ss-3]